MTHICNNNYFSAKVMYMLFLKKVSLVGALVAAALVLSACNLYKSGQQNQTEQPSAPASDAVTVEVTDSGFSPAAATVKSGGKITWTNSSKSAVVIASDPHPSHTANPQLTGGGFTMEIAPGASSSVTVTKTGTWGFHNHLNPGVKGKIVVE